MKILVTGATGYVGSHVCFKLLGAGHEVVGLDNLSNSTGHAVTQLQFLTGKTMQFIQGDIRHRYDLSVALRGVDCVMHLAGLKSVEESMTNPRIYEENNVAGTQTLIEEMGSRGIRKIVFSSSCAVYGEAEVLPMTEATPINPQSPYAASKSACEDLFIKYDLDAINLRYFCPIGSHPTGMLSDRGKTVRNIMPLLLKVACGESDCFHIYGDDYDTRDGTCVRDYLHISDVADGHLSALDLDGSESINLGSEKGYTVYEMIDAVQKVTGVAIPHKVMERRAGDVSALYADCSKAKKLLGWTAKKSIYDAIEDAWQFYCKKH